MEATREVGVRVQGRGFRFHERGGCTVDSRTCLGYLSRTCAYRVSIGFRFRLWGFVFRYLGDGGPVISSYECSRPPIFVLDQGLICCQSFLVIQLLGAFPAGMVDAKLPH